MKFKALFLILFILIFGFGNISFAYTNSYGSIVSSKQYEMGVKVRGGGHVFLCSNQIISKHQYREFLPGSKVNNRYVFFADTYFATQMILNFQASNNLWNVDFWNQYSTDDYINFMVSYIKSHNNYLGLRIESVFKLVTFKFEYKPLEYLKPSFFIPHSCSAHQLAIQYYSDNLVAIDRNLYSRLSNFEKAFFFLHEALLRIWMEGQVLKQDNIEVTPKTVRQVVASIINQEFFENTLLLTKMSPKDRRQLNKGLDEFNPEDLKSIFY